MIDTFLCSKYKLSFFDLSMWVEMFPFSCNCGFYDLKWPVERRHHLTHVQLEQSPLFLHLLRDFSTSDLCPDHSMMFSVFSLLLLDLCSDKTNRCLGARHIFSLQLHAARPFSKKNSNVRGNTGLARIYDTIPSCLPLRFSGLIASLTYSNLLTAF